MSYFDAVELEAIKILKARYFRLLDTRQWDAWGDVFTEDVVLEPAAQMVFRGRAEVVKNVSTLLNGLQTVHHGHMPEIDFIDQNNARGIWAMFDWVEGHGRSMTGYGHYHEEYRRDADGKWRIKKLTLTRLRMDVATKQEEIPSDIP
jgi:ketosteroid isomerase-like protein